MRAVPFVLCLFLACAPALAETVSVADVGTHVGQTVTVEGVVSGVYTAPSGVTFINMGGSYPNNLFTGVILKDDAAKVGDVSGLTGKTVDITGTIKEYKGKPEIVVKSPDQIKVH